MGDFVRHNCGLVVAHSLNDAYSMIKSLQHRGREAAGIAAIGKNRIDVIKWTGSVSKFDLVDLHEILPATDYHTFFAHVRYATKGRKDKILEDAHPHTIGGTVTHNGSHVIIRDCEMAAVHNGQVNDIYFKDIHKSKLKTGCDTEAILHLMKYTGLDEISILQKIPGSYTIAIAHKSKNEVVVLRDALGMMPGVLGKKDGKFVVASEDIALVQNGAEFESDLEPGCIYYLDSDGGRTKKQITKRQNARCMFQYNYIAHARSIIDGKSVQSVRQRLGEQLAKEFSPEVDFVTYLPRCPKVAADAYAEVRGLPFIKAFYKMRGERSFQGPTPEERSESIKSNLFLNDKIIEKIRGKRILVIDDSTIRGNNGKYAIDLLKSVGVKEIYFANYTPKVGIIGADKVKRGCDFGVDMPPESTDFIARENTDEEINQIMGAKVYFMTLNGMLNAFEKAGIPRTELCYFCVGGEHPFKKQ